jgi:hypothetical protein
LASLPKRQSRLAIWLTTAAGQIVMFLGEK